MNAEVETTTYIDFTTGGETGVSLVLRLGLLQVSLDLSPREARRLACALISEVEWRGAGVIGRTLQTTVPAHIDCPLLPRTKFGDHPDYVWVTEQSFEVKR